MKEFKGTPGKWRNRDLSIFTIQMEQKIAVCEIINDNYDAESLANAKLLAKAPELLEALRDMVRLWEYAIVAFTILSEEKAYIKAKKVIEEAI